MHKKYKNANNDRRKINIKITKEAKLKMKARLKELSKIDKAKKSSKIRSEKRNNTSSARCNYCNFNYFSNNKY